MKKPRALRTENAKRRGGKTPTLTTPLLKEQAVSVKDYAAMSPLKLGGYEGPTGLDKLNKPKKPRL